MFFSPCDLHSFGKIIVAVVDFTPTFKMWLSIGTLVVHYYCKTVSLKQVLRSVCIYN